ncbi:transposable element, partial [Pseudoloma neurophilia]
ENIYKQTLKEKALGRIDGSLFGTKSYQKMEEIKIKYKVGKSKTEFERNLPILENLQQNIFYFRGKFEITSKRARWDEVENRTMLKEAVTDALLHLIENAVSTENAFDQILQTKYTTDCVLRVTQFAYGLKLKNFTTATEYVATIDACLKILDIHKNLQGDLLKDKRSEIFYNGLGNEVHTWAKSQGLYNPEDLLSRIESIGNSIITSIRRSLMNQTQFHSNHFNHKSTDSTNKPNSFKGKFNYEQQKKQTDEKKINELEKCPPLRFSEILVFMNGNRTKCLIDTGAEISLVLRNLVDTMNLKISPLNDKITLKMANNDTTVASKGVMFQIKNNSKTVKNTTDHQFVILEKSNSQIIFGTDLIHKLSIEFTFKDTGLYLMSSDTIHNPHEPIFDLTCETEISSISDFDTILLNYETALDHDKPIKGFKMKIDLTTDKPPESKYNRPTAQESIEADKVYDDLLEKEVIEKCNSLYSSPSFLREKASGKFNLIVDYTDLNTLIVPLNEYFPDIKEVFHEFAKAKIFSKIDLTQGFYQIEIAHEDRHKTAFSTHRG